MIKLKLIADAEPAVLVTVTAVAVLLSILTLLVPVTVNPVTPVTFHTVPVPVVVILPVPNAKVLVFVLDDKNVPTDKFTPLFMVIVPANSSYVPVVLIRAPVPTVTVPEF